MSNHRRITELLNAKPGLKASSIARELGIGKSEVNSALYGQLDHIFKQDKSYRWWPRKECVAPAGKNEFVDTQHNSFIGNLCRYYLECIEKDRDDGVSVFAKDKYDNPDYAELTSSPFAEDSDVGSLYNDNVKKFLNKVSRDRNKKTLYLGYPVRLKRIISKKGWEGFMVEPIFLFSLDSLDSNNLQELKLNDRLPFLNASALKNFLYVDSGNLTDEIIQLTDDLGLDDATKEMPDIDDVVARLKSVRPQWDWVENVDPHHLTTGISLGEINTQGIYNRAIVVATEGSTYTRGLETELSKLAKEPEAKLSDTALGAWLDLSEIKNHGPSKHNLIEILPLNTEQRQAVKQGLERSITVITGPPGTGKSQVVGSLLINAAWQGKKILFASKNNKAVDVVEVRVNALGSRPILLRTGKSEYQKKLVEYLTSLLSSSCTEKDQVKYNYYKQLHNEITDSLEMLESELNDIIELRNAVDTLDIKLEEHRAITEDRSLKKYQNVDIDKFRELLNKLSRSLDNAVMHEQPFLVNLLWFLFKDSRYRNIAHSGDCIEPIASYFDIQKPKSQPDNNSISEWKNFRAALTWHYDIALKYHDYRQQLTKLNEARPMEDVSRNIYDTLKRLADNSENMWKYWLRVQPSRLDVHKRRKLGDYCSLLQMMVEANEQNQSVDGGIFRKYYTLFPEISSFLPCWAVTSLSARKIPFQAGYFDIVVIDEASQCDIASALPLLFRAKQAVIIGDPKQLKHISGLNKKQDRQLLEKHKLVDSHMNWSYSINSLFDLASRICGSDDIVDLRDHHRSHSDIIAFSNKHFYEGRLRVATQYDRINPVWKKEKALRWINVCGNVIRPSTGGAVNSVEAKAVLAELERIISQGYSGSIGVVSPFRAQAALIRDYVSQSSLIAGQIASMDFLSETVYKFQGDERDVMLFSPVVSNGVPSTALGFLKNNPYIFNVAITRARSSLIVVGDYNAALNCNVDYLSKFATYVSEHEPSNSEDTIINVEEFGLEYPTVAKPELVSDWERVFYASLYSSGIKAIPQYNVEQYLLDFAVLVGSRRLNIEIDGERYHRNWDGELCRRDQIRNQRLMELGWDVMRFWVYQVRDDMDYCISRVKSWLDKGN